MEDRIPAPSGAVLPLLLRKKWRNQQSSSQPIMDPSSSNNPSSNPAMELQKSRMSHSIFSAEEIEERMRQISHVAIADIQKQLYRGEEEYFEDTHGHGNLWRGWDGLVDAKEIGNTSANAPQQGPRRVPADSRWFSGSFRNVSRTVRPQVPVASTPTPMESSRAPVVSSVGTTTIIGKTNSTADIKSNNNNNNNSSDKNITSAMVESRSTVASSLPDTEMAVPTIAASTTDLASSTIKDDAKGEGVGSVHSNVTTTLKSQPSAETSIQPDETKPHDDDDNDNDDPTSKHKNQTAKKKDDSAKSKETDTDEATTTTTTSQPHHKRKVSENAAVSIAPEEPESKKANTQEESTPLKEASSHVSKSKSSKKITESTSHNTIDESPEKSTIDDDDKSGSGTESAGPGAGKSSRTDSNSKKEGTHKRRSSRNRKS